MGKSGEVWLEMREESMTLNDYYHQQIIKQNQEIEEQYKQQVKQPKPKENGKGNKRGL